MSGALSANPKTGKVRVDCDTETMTIVVTKDTTNDDRSGNSKLTSFLAQLAQDQKKVGISYGGRGPKSALQTRIGLDKNTGFS